MNPQEVDSSNCPLPAGRARRWLPGLLLFVAILLAYLPALHGGFLWDDDTHISDNATLRSATGLYEIWFKPGATCQYYPLTFSAWWVGYQLWGLSTPGYHLLNVLMHGVVAVLFWQFLKRLQLRGAWLAAAIFALHPVCVMSVAWMTELKNTLSAALALGAALAYVRFAELKGELKLTSEQRGSVLECDGPPPLLSLEKRQRAGAVQDASAHTGGHWIFAILALLLFLAAMFAKTAVSFLPVTLLLMVWWKEPRLTWRRLWPLLTMLGIAVAMGLLTIHVEQRHGTAVNEFQLGWLERVLVSGRSFWFYLGKLFFPYPLPFIYERWQINPRVWWQYLFPIATIAFLAGLWLLRDRLGRGPFVAAAHFFIATSALVLIQVLYMMRYTFVSDHWQYFGSMSVIAAAAAGVSKVLKLDESSKLEIRKGFLPPGFCIPLSLSLLLPLSLSLLTWNQCRQYASTETLWRSTLARNPGCWMAHNNLGNDLLDRGEADRAIAHFERALAIQTNDAFVYFSLGSAFRQQGRTSEALATFQRGLALQPDNSEAQDILGVLLLEQRRPNEAMEHFQNALKLQPDDAQAHGNLGNALLQVGKNESGIAELRRAIGFRPDFAEAHFNLGCALSAGGHFDEAILHFQQAAQLQPRDPAIHVQWGLVLVRQGKFSEATAQFQTAANLQPDDADTCRSLAWVLATCPEMSVRNGAKAVELAEKANRLTGSPDLAFLGTLAAAYAEADRFPDAATVGEQALRLAKAQGNTAAAEAIQRRIGLYLAGQPFRDTSQTNATGVTP